MLVSPFTFFRGAALVMAADLAATPDSGITVQCCGDAHLSNFGVFGSPERRLIFDINDFDETLPGPWEWDLKRLAASFEVAGRDRGFSPLRSPAGGPGRRPRVPPGDARRRPAGARSTSGTRTWTSAQMLEWIRTEHDDKRRDRKQRHEAVVDVAKARTRDSTRAFKKLTSGSTATLRFVADPPLIVPLEDLVLSPEARHQTEQLVAQAHQEVPAHAGRRAPSAGGVPLRPHGPQGGRRGQRRHPGVDLPHDRCRRPATR